MVRLGTNEGAHSVSQPSNCILRVNDDQNYKLVVLTVESACAASEVSPTGFDRGVRTVLYRCGRYPYRLSHQYGLIGLAGSISIHPDHLEMKVRGAP